jgi:Family of unknown function (DUF6328)
MPRASSDDQDEQEQQVLELLNELRVILPGVQVLFAFLLTVPFSQRFSQLGSTDRAVYFGALLLAAGSSAMLIAPSLHARILGRGGDKAWLIRVSTPLTIAGGTFLAAGIACAVYLVADVLYHSRVAGVTTSVVVVVILLTWYGIPIVGRMRGSAERS